VIVRHGETDLHDILLVENNIAFVSRGATERPERIRETHELGNGVWLGPIERELMKAVINACEPKGENFHPIINAHAHYGFYRHKPYSDGDNLYGFDQTGELRRALRLSRLVRPTSTGQEYAARVVTTPGIPERMIVPARATGMGTKAYVIDTDSDWMSDDHARALVPLVTAYDHASTPLRMKLALFHFEYSAWTYYIDLRWTLLTTAAEALTHIEGERDPRNQSRYAGSTQQFVSRMAGMRAIVPGLSYSDTDLRGMYRARSGVVHGQDYAHQDPEIRRLYALLESSMRSILRFLLLNPSAAAIFASDATVQAALPL
jgi:hypothetical protein